MSHRSRFAIVLVAALVVLAGCGGTSEQGTTTPNATAESNATSTETATPNSTSTPTGSESNESSNESTEESSPSDTTPPTLAIVQPSDGYTATPNATQVVVKFSATDGGSGVDFDTLSVVESRSGTNLTNRIQQTGSTISVSVPVEQDNTYTVEISVKDKAGNPVDSSVTFSVPAEGEDENTTSSTNDTSTSDNETTTQSSSGDDSDSLGPTEPDNTEPSANITLETSGELVVDESVSFDGSASTDPDGDTLNHTWEFSDGTTVTGVSVSHAFSQAGNYTVTLTVDDGWGGTDTETMNVTILQPNDAPNADVYANTTLVLVDDKIQFNASNSSDPNNHNISYDWKFDDGTTATGATPVHAYNGSGDYTATVTVTDERGKSDSATVDIEVRDSNAAPNADAGPNKTVKNLSFVQLNGTNSSDPDGDNLTYHWDFGDNTGVTDASSTPYHKYTERGQYTVTLVVEDSFGETDIDTTTVNITNNPPNASLTVPSDPLPVNHSVNFSASNSSDLDSDSLAYDWYFGDGSSVIGGNDSESHTYTQTGTYEVTVNVSDGFGGFDTRTVAVSVENTPPKNVTINGKNETIVGYNTTYTTNATDLNGDTLGYTWYFPNATYTTADVTHAFESAGNHTVRLNVSDGHGNTVTKNRTVYVRDNNTAPSVTISDGNRTVFNGTLTEFLANASDSDGDDITYDWSIETGSGTVTGTGPDASNLYETEGDFNVSVTVTDEFGASDTDEIVVSVVNNPPNATLPAESSSRPVDASTNFAVNASDYDGDNLTYDWEFGDGNTAMAAGDAVSYTYNQTGNYTLNVTVTDEHGASTTESKTVVVENLPPTADAADNYREVIVNDTVNFDGTNSSDPNGDPLTFDWDFGDGSTSTGATTNHTYTETGTYNVTLTTTDDANNSDSETVTVVVEPNNTAPTADAGSNMTVETNVSATFNASNSSDPDGDNLTYDWDFGDGATATGEVVNHTYDTEGTYNATVTVTDEHGATDTDTIVVSVENTEPTAAAGADDTIVVGSTYEFDGTNSSDPNGDTIAFNWDVFDDGTYELNGSTPKYTFNKTGNHDVNLTVTDEHGANGSDIVTISVYNTQPVADAGEDFNATVNTDVEFNATDSYDPDSHNLTYDWDFDDGATLDNGGPTPTHNFSSTGKYYVNVTVSDGYGGTDTDTVIVTVEK